MTFYKTILAAGALALSAGTASAAHLSFTDSSPIDGNDCSGVFGSGFENCVYDGSPVIAKFNFNDGFEITSTEINSFFPSIDGSEFTFGTTDLGGGTLGYTFNYSPDDDTDPAITAFVAKGSNSFNLYDGYDGSDVIATNTDIVFVTPVNPKNGKYFALSHITFYDTTMNVIPVPAAGFLLLAGLGGLAALRRRT